MDCVVGAVRHALSWPLSSSGVLAAAHAEFLYHLNLPDFSDLVLLSLFFLSLTRAKSFRESLRTLVKVPLLQQQSPCWPGCSLRCLDKGLGGPSSCSAGRHRAAAVGFLWPFPPGPCLGSVSRGDEATDSQRCRKVGWVWRVQSPRFSPQHCGTK